MECLIRFSQSHETFRLPEIQALAVVEGIELKVVSYSVESPFCVVRLPSEDAARRLVRRSVLVQSIHEVWGSGTTLDAVHATVVEQTAHLWGRYMTCSFKFTIDSYQRSRSNEDKVRIINSFAYLGFAGPIKMRNPDQEFTLFEDWPFNSTPLGLADPKSYYLGRYLATGARDLPQKLDLKKRRYISTTSMDAELALVTANIALAAPGKLMYDPFVGTGSFPIACAQFGALAFGSDIDGRSIRGDEKKKTLHGNFEQYGLLSELGGVFTADLTNSPIRKMPLGTSGDGVRGRLFDGIICDPPYGVREGLRVLGVRDPEKSPWVIPKGIEMYKQPDFIPPKKPYGFLAMLDDILQFSAQTLVDNGRLSFWIPTANDEDQEIEVPTHPYLEIVAVCTQVFSKWSRRLITYRRIPDAEVDQEAMKARVENTTFLGRTADELNPFRRAYFTGFEA
ncbi:S-adenosyl-L-methionine-dependent methyltransferase [Lasiosphaeria miniovina]|uniref:tRNA (guanine(10)-N(2))-methyltransferase n=1 Tax=Lasiosphaeria miniovina TaxID=1954250 RepID=A0AA40AU98_9PEZI|nr:S-adenosyl-L-methionine-dependent methyltransferase [Lasiosphaeria miniovina]KAK0722039.1 S-adenosyl-L-methionine-dependent methyltransferase [Lasiosphaeria miniovina]